MPVQNGAIPARSGESAGGAGRGRRFGWANGRAAGGAGACRAGARGPRRAAAGAGGGGGGAGGGGGGRAGGGGGPAPAPPGAPGGGPGAPGPPGRFSGGGAPKNRARRAPAGDRRHTPKSGNLYCLRKGGVMPRGVKNGEIESRRLTKIT